MTCGPVKLSLPWSLVLLLRNHLVSGFLGNSAGEESICNAGDPGLIPGSGSSPGEGIDYSFQYFWSSLMVQTVKNPPANAGDMGLIPGLGRSPGEGIGNPFQYSCLENPMDRGA